MRNRNRRVMWFPCETQDVEDLPTVEEVAARLLREEENDIIHDMVMDGITTMGGGVGDFPVTSWTSVLRAADPHSPEARDHLGRLCNLYWKPVYAHIRRRWAKTNEDAKDLTQTFFAWFMEKGCMERVERGRGRFRNFLKVILDNFLKDQERARKALAKGGGVRIFSIDAGDDPMVLAAASDSRPVEFDEVWAATMLDQALKTLRERYASNGQENHFRAFEKYYLGQAQPTYVQLAEELKITEQEVEKILKHARAALKGIIRAFIQETLEDPSEIDDELLHLFKEGLGL